jgi:hypothetical protein
MASAPPRDSRAREKARLQRARQVRRRRLVMGIVVLGVIGVIVGLAVGLPGRGDSTSTTSPTGTTGGSAGSGQTTTTIARAFTARLTGDNEVPPVSTAATGSLTMTVEADGSAMRFMLSVAGLTNTSVARVHEGGFGSSGPEVLTLFTGPTKTGLYSGIVAHGSITSADLVGPLQGKTIADFISLIEGGTVYVNVGTTTHVNGAIRGQLE